MKKFIENWGIAFALIFIITVFLLMINLTKSQAQDNHKLVIIPNGTGKTAPKPNANTLTVIEYLQYNPSDGKNYRWNGSTQKWAADTSKMFQGIPGPTGATGVGIDGVSVVTGAPGSQGSAVMVQIPDKRDKAIVFTIPRGDQGIQGPQGPPGQSGGSVNLPFYDAGQFGAVNSDITFAQNGKDQNYINTNFPGIGATVNDCIDWAAWQLMVNAACNNSKPIIVWGQYYFHAKQVLTPKFFLALTIYGNCYIHVTGTDGSAVFKRPTPIDNGDAGMMIGNLLAGYCHVNIDGVNIEGDGQSINRIGFDINSTYNSVYKNISCHSIQECIHLRFCLNTEIEMCMATSCVSGWTADIGNWPGAGTANSQSNVTTFSHCRFYARDNSDYAFGIYACSGIVGRDNIIEGAALRAGVDYDSKFSTVVKSFAFYNTHVEAVNGFTEAAFKLKLTNGIAVIDGIYGQHPAVMVDAFNYGGNSYVYLLHSVYWAPHATKKYFVNNGVGWIVSGNGNLLTNPTLGMGEITTKFTGTIPTYIGSGTALPGNYVTVDWTSN